MTTPPKPAAAPSEAERAGRKLNPNIQGARGLFASFVFCFHMVQAGLPPPTLPFWGWVDTAAHSLAYGVELFFVISGIVILGAFRRARSTSAFLVDRVTRIFPVLWVSMTVVFVLTLLGKPVLFDGMSAAAVGLTYLGNLLALPPVIRIPLIHPAAWSLSYEFAFYLLFAVFAGLAGLVSRRAAFLLTVLLAVAVYWIHVRAIFFAAGLMIGAGWMSRPGLAPLLRFPLLWMAVFLAAWHALALQVGGNIHAAVLSRLAVEPGLLALAVVAFVAGLLSMSGIEQGRGWLSAFLRLPVMQWLGAISFSLYLWQTPVMAVVKRGMLQFGVVDLVGPWSQPVFFLLSLIPTLAVSVLSQRYLEVGVTNWLRAHRTFGAATHLRASRQA